MTPKVKAMTTLMDNERDMVFPVEKQNTVLYLDMIRQENGAGEASSDSAPQIDDADSNPSGQLLQVTHHDHLESNSYEELDCSGKNHHIFYILMMSYQW